MIERLQNITAKYQELVEELTHEDVLQDYNKLRKLSKEKADLEEIVLKIFSVKILTLIENNLLII